MISPFENLNRAPSPNTLKKVGEEVKKSNAGRPPRPNAGKYLITMDRALHKKIKEEAVNLGCSVSFIISEEVKKRYI